MVLFSYHYLVYAPGEAMTCTASANPSSLYDPDDQVLCSVDVSDTDAKNCTTNEADTVHTYSWTANGGSFLNGVTNLEEVTWIAPDAAGTYTVTVTVSDPDDDPQDYCGSKSDPDATDSISMPMDIGIVYVSKDGVPPLDGDSWDHAFDSIQDGIDSASSGDEVWVAEGEYEENIIIDSEIQLYGGFAGNEIYTEARDFAANETILDGGQAGSVVIVNNVIDQVAISGFTIQNGMCGVYCSSASPTIANNVITSNAAYYYGGGICCESCPDVNILDNVLCGNTDGWGWGSAICLISSSGVIANNTIADNTGGGSQYAVGLLGAYSYELPVTFANNIIAFNASGLYTQGGDDFTISNNCFYNPAGDDYDCGGRTLEEDNLFVDPEFVPAGGYHLDADYSPCVDSGDNAYTRTDVPDMDGQYRIRNGYVDIGADESELGCIWYSIEMFALLHCAEAGDTVTVTGRVFQPWEGPACDCRVDFTVDNGGTLVSPAAGYLNTASDGGFTATVSRDTSGYLTLTAEVTNPCGGTTTSEQLSIWFYPSTASSDDAWPMFMHDPQHTGASLQEDSESESLTLAWSAAVPTSVVGRWDISDEHPATGGYDSAIFAHPYIDSSPVHAAGCPVIVGAWESGDYGSSTEGYVVAFDPVQGTNTMTGDPVWRFPETGHIGAVASTPCIAEVNGEKLVYFGSMDGKLYCLNAQTGEFQWAYQTTSRGSENPRILASPVVYGSRVYIGNESAKFYCLNAENGNCCWSFDLPDADSTWPDRTGTTSPALHPDGTKVFVGCDNWHVYCLDTADSPVDRILWDYDTQSGCVESSPTYYDGKVYFGASCLPVYYDEYNLFALNAQTGTSEWRQELEQEVRGTCAAADGAVYVGIDTGHYFYKRSAVNGSDLSHYYGGDYFVSSAALSRAGLAYVGNDNGYFYCLPTATLYAETATYDTQGIISSSPAITYAAEDGARWVFVTSRANGGMLFAFRTAL